MEVYRQRELLPGIRLCCVQTDRFRRAVFSVSFLRPLRREEAAKNALLMHVLARGSRACPDMQRFRAACQEAWGAEVEPSANLPTSSGCSMAITSAIIPPCDAPKRQRFFSPSARKASAVSRAISRTG